MAYHEHKWTKTICERYNLCQDRWCLAILDLFAHRVIYG